MAENIKLQIDTSDLEADLKKVDQRGKSLRPVMLKVAVLFKNAVNRNFKEGGRASSDPDSPIGGNQRWKKLAPATILSRLRKENKGRSLYTKKGATRKGVLSSVRKMKILQDDGTLKKSLTAQADNASAEVTTNLDYAPAQHYGTNKAGKSKNVKIPARPFMQVQQSDADLAKKMVEDYVIEPTK